MIHANLCKIDKKGRGAVFMKIKKFISSVLALCLMCTMVTLRPETVFASEKNVGTNQIFSEKDVESIMPFFEILEKIPMELLEEGDSSKVNNYFRENGLSVHIYNPEKVKSSELNVQMP